MSLVLGMKVAGGGGRATAQGPAPAAGRASTFRNPLKVSFGADPWMTHHDGWYYMATTSGTDVRLSRARRLANLRSAAERVVWRGDHPARSRDIWGPNLHRLDGGDGPRWFLYYTASDGQMLNHRMYVAQSAGDDPMGPYRLMAKLQTDPGDRHMAIDGTIMPMPSGSIYFAWCGHPSLAGQGLYLSRMANPWTLIGPRVELPAAGFGCKEVREAPVSLRHGDSGRVFLVYSACSADTPDYKLGMLSIDPAADPMDPTAWRQHPRPVFVRDDKSGVYGPGSCDFFRSPDGREDWLVYHAKAGTARTFEDRTARAQRFGWRLDGTPDFDRPLPIGVEIPAPSGEPGPTDLSPIP